MDMDMDMDMDTDMDMDMDGPKEDLGHPLNGELFRVRDRIARRVPVRQRIVGANASDPSEHERVPHGERVVPLLPAPGESNVVLELVVVPGHCCKAASGL